MFIIEAAKQLDSRAVWEIRYHPLVNQQSSNTQAVDFANHDRWFQEKYFSGGPNQCFVLRGAGRLAGYCRFDAAEGNEFRVSIAIHPDYQGQGLGQKLLAESLSRLPAGKKVLAVIKRGNKASIKLFQKNGFALEKTEPENYFLNKTL